VLRGISPPLRLLFNDNNLKGREEVLTHIAEPSSRNSAKKPKPFVFPVGSGQVRPTNQFR